MSGQIACNGRPVRLLLLVVPLALAAGLVRFTLARPPIEVRFARSAPADGLRRDLAHFKEGPIVRASSVFAFARHHPGYVVDGQERPTLLEKWVSAPGDLAPFIEVQLDRARQIDEVALELAGAHEDQDFTMRRYRLECFAGAQLIARLQIDANAQPRPGHALRCPSSDRVRVTFAAEPDTPRDVARVYELLVLGQ